MPYEVAFFWLVIGAFLCFDNLIIIPRGCDLLRLGRRGLLRYDSSSRLTAAGREVVLLNPLNLFDRGLVTSRCFGDIEPRLWRQGRFMVVSVLPTLNILSRVGYVYLVFVVGLAYLSFKIGFTPALVAFIGLHLIVWCLCVGVMLAQRRNLQLTGYELLSYAAEALFVPAYLINLGKRLLNKRRVEISALGLGLRTLKQLADEDERSMLAARLNERLEVLEMAQGQEAAPDGIAANRGVDQAGKKGAVDQAGKAEMGAADGAAQTYLTDTQQWIMMAKTCLTT